MSDVIARAMSDMAFISSPTYDDYVQTDKESRLLATSLLPR